MYLVFDIGGTNLRAGVSEDGRSLLRAKSVLTPKSYQAGLEAIFALGQELSQGEIEKAAIAVAGVVDGNKLMKARNLPQWSEQPLAEDFFEHFQVQPIIRNDAEMAALGEAEFGAGKNYASLLYLTISTGLGGAWVKRDPELISINLAPGKQIIDSGSGADLEQFISGGGLEARYGLKAKDIKDPAIWADVARKLALGIATNLTTHPAEAVVLGGALVINDRIDFNLIRDELKKLGGPQPILLKTALGNEAGLFGGLVLLTNNAN
jgi:predicted NBD/HSP70 family sugar kinase